MNKDEFKNRIVAKIDELIDVYYGEDNVVDRLTNSTLKIFVDANINKIDNMLRAVSDENGEINVETIISRYTDAIPDEGINVDIKQFIKNDIINSLLPNKSLNITKDDIANIISK